jgi:Uma2 family endonuclease
MDTKRAPIGPQSSRILAAAGSEIAIFQQTSALGEGSALQSPGAFACRSRYQNDLVETAEEAPLQEQPGDQTMTAHRTKQKGIYYPESNGKPVAESDVHRDWMVLIIELLQFFFSGKRVYVSGNLLIYYVEGDPKKSVAPATFVVKDCEQRQRRTYKIWEEGKAPNFILETTSKKTHRVDLRKKKEVYARLRVPEYFLYDPLSEWLQPPLRGYRLVGENYVLLEPGKDSGIASEHLGITFRLEDGKLALFETATGKRLQSGAERARDAEARAA